MRALQALNSNESATDNAVAMYLYSEAIRLGNETAEEILQDFNGEVVPSFSVLDAPRTIEEVYLDLHATP